MEEDHVVHEETLVTLEQIHDEPMVIPEQVQEEPMYLQKDHDQQQENGQRQDRVQKKEND